MLKMAVYTILLSSTCPLLEKVIDPRKHWLDDLRGDIKKGENRNRLRQEIESPPILEKIVECYLQGYGEPWTGRPSRQWEGKEGCWDFRLILIFLSPVFSDLQRKIMVDQIFVFAYFCICCRDEFMSSFLIISNIKLLLFSSYMIIGLSCHFSLFLFSMTPNNFNRINNATVFQILFQTEMIPWLCT